MPFGISQLDWVINPWLHKGKMRVQQYSTSIRTGTNSDGESSGSLSMACNSMNGTSNCAYFIGPGRLWCLSQNLN